MASDPRRSGRGATEASLMTCHLLMFSFVAWAAACTSPRTADQAIEIRDDLMEVFDSAGILGTFVLYDPATVRLTVVGSERAATRFVAASTFKLPHSLIGLETGVVTSIDEVIPFGGNPQPFAGWERDMSLREAVPASNVPVFQEVARRVGRERMQGWLDRLDYGNRAIGPVNDRFWLDGPLEISATEQVRFLSRLATGTLPANSETQASVRTIALLEEGGGYRVYGKTGWAFDVVPQVGWWVGWIDSGGSIQAFALNVEIRSAEDAAKRIPVGRELLRRLQVLPNAP